jgi:hypothetical protein
MEKTVSDASNMPIESQISPIRNHRDDRSERMLMRAPMLRSYYIGRVGRDGLQPTAGILQ